MIVKILLVMTVFIGLGVGGMSLLPQMDPLMTPERMAAIQASPNYRQGEFQPSTPHTKTAADWKDMRKLFFPVAGDNMPKDKLITAKTDLKALNPHENVLVWLGHASFYMQLDGKKILIDPVFADHTAPLPFICKMFAGSRVYTANDMPDDIDVLVLTHDHCDHLDYDATKALEPKVHHVVTGLGNGGYYEKWGYPLTKIHEVDWDKEVKITSEFYIWLLPTRPFFGRLFKKNKTLASSVAFITPRIKVYCIGNGGYDDRFQKIGQRFGPFDVALVEDGQYNEHWATVHMMPEESAKVGEEVHAREVIPYHNSTVALAPHQWKEPLERLVKAAPGKHYKLAIPCIGQKVELGNLNQSFDAWWRHME